MSFIYEKYTPKTFSDFSHSPSTTNKLKALATNTSLHEGLSNILLYGPSGNGKYARLMVTLSSYFKGTEDPNRTSVKAIEVESGTFFPISNVKKSNKKVIMAFVSKCHCEIDLEQANANKTLLPFLLFYSKTKNIHLNTHKYILLRNIEYLTREKQNAL